MTTLEFRLPDVGEGIAEAEIVSWHVEVGQHVQRDEPLLEVETDKSLLDIPSPCNGVLREQGAAAGQVVPVGTLLARIETDSQVEEAELRDEPETSTPVSADARDTPATDQADGQRATPPRRPLASPATRRLASRLSVDLSTVEGTGPAGRITRGDVEHAAQLTPHEQTAGTPVGSPLAIPATAEDEVVALRGVRRQVARSMSAAALVPTIYEWRDVDATALVAAVRRVREHLGPNGPRVTVLSFVARAVAAAAADCPRMNATFDPDHEELTLRAHCNVGIATATDDGLLVPVVRDAGHRSLASLASAIAELSQRARRREITPDDTREGSITISNFGSFGTVSGTPLLRLPEVAIVGVGRVTDKVLAFDGAPHVRPTLPLSVATDHRVNDGVHLAAFCSALEELLTDPVLLLAGP